MIEEEDILRVLLAVPAHEAALTPQEARKGESQAAAVRAETESRARKQWEKDLPPLARARAIATRNRWEKDRGRRAAATVRRIRKEARNDLECYYVVVYERMRINIKVEG